MLVLDINPFVGVNDYKFGLTQPAIAKKNGVPAKAEIDNIMEEIREYRQGIQLTFVKKKLVDIIVKKDERPIFNHIDIFNDTDALHKLQDFSQTIKAKNNAYWLFPDLGICIGGLAGKKIPEGKLVIVFAQSRLQFYEIYLDM